MRKIKAAIFDIDGTLAEKNSWHVIALAMGGTAEEDLEIYYAEKSGKLTSEEARNRILTLWTRQGLATKENFERIFHSISLRDDAIDVVQYLKKKRLLVCLITGSMDMYAKIIAGKVNANEYYSNAKLSWGGDGVIEDFSYNVDQGAIKVKQFNDFIKKYSLEPEECIVIGDSENDRGLFGLTKRGIAIRTDYEDKHLETLAWKVVNNLSEIKEFIN